MGAPGAIGLQGPTGAAGSGIFASGSSAANTYFTTLGVCVNYQGATVTVNAPAAGTVMVTANAQMLLFHTSGTTDEFELAIGSNPADCGYMLVDITWETPSSFPSFSSNYQTFTVTRSFSVPAAGSYTYYLTGVKITGGTDSGSQDNFNWAYLYAVFYPG
jgi:hypothetical protein